jgi:multiple inositol-polyphosphate phosphatase/2,3-bisphosphoglycerate 3-phosphatase
VLQSLWARSGSVSDIRAYVPADVLLASQEVTLPPPLPPPHPRAWRGSIVAPFGANTALVLYDCGRNVERFQDVNRQRHEREEREQGNFVGLLPRAVKLLRWGALRPTSTEEKSLDYEDEFLVLALHNERPVAMPACGGALFCPFEVFREEVLGPHMKGSFDKTCALTGWKFVVSAWFADGLSWLGVREWPWVQ